MRADRLTVAAREKGDSNGGTRQAIKASWRTTGPSGPAKEVILGWGNVLSMEDIGAEGRCESLKGCMPSCEGIQRIEQEACI